MTSTLALVAGIAAGLAAVAAAVGLLYQARGVRRDRRRYPPPGTLVDVGGHRLHGRVMGDGAPVVVLESGVAASSINWSRVQSGVATLTRVVAYDRAGYAWSELAATPRRAGQAAEELRALLGGLDLPPPYVLVGHSYGGLVIRSFVRRFPDAVAGLVFVDTTFPEEWRELPAERRRLLRGGVIFSRIGVLLARLGVVRACLALLSAGRGGVPRAVARGFGQTALHVLSRMVGEVQKMPAELWPVIQSHWSQSQSFAAMASHLAHLPDSADDAGACTTFGDVPTIVLSAAGLRPEIAARHGDLARMSSRGRHVASSQSGHWIHLDEPELVVSAIREVVELVRRDS